MNYYCRFPGDYLRDTIHLSAAEDGMYGRLLDAIYTSEKPLPLDRDILYALVRANSDADRTAVESVLKQYFRKKKHGFSHKRVEQEIARKKAKSEAYRVSGRKGGLKRQAIAKQSLEIGLSETQAFHIPHTTPTDHKNSNSTTEREALADWIPIGLWGEYRAMREKNKRLLTSGAIDILIEDLRKLREAGEDISEVLKQAIKGGWFEFKAVRKEKQNDKLDPKKRSERNLRNAGLVN